MKLIWKIVFRNTDLVRRRTAADEEAVPLHELGERVADRVAGPADPDRLHHARVAQLATAQLTVEDLRGRETR